MSQPYYAPEQGRYDNVTFLLCLPRSRKLRPPSSLYRQSPCMQQKPCPPPPWRRSPWKLTMPRPTVQQMTPRSFITSCITAE